jgi:hypothetical protein
VPWERAARLLAASRYYWLSTTRPDGRPHSVPVWAVWREGSLFFATGPGTVTARNLAANPNAVAHLDDPREVVIVEGTVSSRGQSVSRDVPDAYEAKYGWRLDSADPGMPFYELRAWTALAWLAEDVRGTAARWRF